MFNMYCWGTNLSKKKTFCYCALFVGVVTAITVAALPRAFETGGSHRFFFIRIKCFPKIGRYQFFWKKNKIYQFRCYQFFSLCISLMYQFEIKYQFWFYQFFSQFFKSIRLKLSDAIKIQKSISQFLCSSKILWFIF